MTVVPLRTFTIGGSDAAAAAGIDPHKSRVMLFLEKMGRVERAETEAMRWGKLLEPVIFEELRGRGMVMWSCAPVSDEARPWLTGTPDGYVREHEDDEGAMLLEVKTVGQWAKREWNGTPPLAYVAQCQHYLHLTGLDRALLAVLVGGQRLELATIARDDEAIRRLLALEEEFYGYLIRDELPAMRHDDAEAARVLWPVAEQGKVMRLDRDMMAFYRQLKLRKAQRDAVDEQVKTLENLLKAAMRGAEVAIGPHDDELIRWPSVESHRVDVKALREAHPAIAAEFVKVTHTRRFQAL
jgi:putative phage-type endonuclease